MDAFGAEVIWGGFLVWGWVLLTQVSFLPETGLFLSLDNSPFFHLRRPHYYFFFSHLSPISLIKRRRFGGSKRRLGVMPDGGGK